MTTTQPSLAMCPSCQAEDSIDLDDGARLCLACRHEWKPSEVDWSAIMPATAPPSTVEERADLRDILAAETIADVLAPAMSPAELVSDHTGVTDDPPEPKGWEGRFAYDAANDETYLVVEDEGDEEVLAETATGRRVMIVRGDLVLVEDADTTTDAARSSGPPADDEPWPELTMTVCALSLMVGAQSVTDDAERRLMNPRIGWLPPPANDLPEVEQGAAYAVAMLVRFYGLPIPEVMEMAENMLAGVVETTGETEQE